jgi:alpha-beta hydrolase superfamily lysophospholipase
MFIPGGRLGVLLIHGLGGTPIELRFVAQALARAGHTVYCCQLAGHCGTPEELRRSTWREWYASVEAAHDMLRERCDIIVAGGLSMGGILAIHLAHNRPESVHGLLLFAPTLRLDGWSMPWYSRPLHYVRPLPIKLEFDLADEPLPGDVEHPPVRRLKSRRVRAKIEPHHRSAIAAHRPLVVEIRQAMIGQLFRCDGIRIGALDAIPAAPTAGHRRQRPGSKRVARFEHQIAMRRPRMTAGALVQ